MNRPPVRFLALSQTSPLRCGSRRCVVELHLKDQITRRPVLACPLIERASVPNLSLPPVDLVSCLVLGLPDTPDMGDRRPSL
jgi:hypothetical protein